jgi:hypothetical protein
MRRTLERPFTEGEMSVVSPSTTLVTVTVALWSDCPTPLGASERPSLKAQLLGHASVAITLDTYSHMLPGMGSEAADAMANVLG